MLLDGTTEPCERRTDGDTLKPVVSDEPQHPDSELAPYIERLGNLDKQVSRETRT
jgi:hypothetical protein